MSDDDVEPTEAQKSLAYHGQMKSLGLRPWQSPPMWLNEDVQPPDGPANIANVSAWQILRLMLALGIDRYHPDPIRAIAEARARR